MSLITLPSLLLYLLLLYSYTGPIYISIYIEYTEYTKPIYLSSCFLLWVLDASVTVLSIHLLVCFQCLQFTIDNCLCCQLTIHSGRILFFFHTISTTEQTAHTGSTAYILPTSVRYTSRFWFCRSRYWLIAKLKRPFQICCVKSQPTFCGCSLLW